MELYKLIYEQANIYRLQEAQPFKNSQEVLTAIKDGSIIKLLNGKKNMPKWLSEMVSNGKGYIDEGLFDGFANIIDLFEGQNDAVNETICFLIKKADSLNTFLEITSSPESLQLLKYYGKSYKSQWFKQSSIKDKLENSPYDKDVWSSCCTEIKHKLEQTRQKHGHGFLADENNSLYTRLYASEDGSWRLYIPKNFQGSAELASHMAPFGKGESKTHWCTAADPTYYDMYTYLGTQPLYIIKKFEGDDCIDAWQIAFMRLEYIPSNMLDEPDGWDNSYYDEDADEFVGMEWEESGEFEQLQDLYDNLYGDDNVVYCMDKFDKEDISFIKEIPDELANRIEDEASGKTLLDFKKSHPTASGVDVLTNFFNYQTPEQVSLETEIKDISNNIEIPQGVYLNRHLCTQLQDVLKKFPDSKKSQLQKYLPSIISMIVDNSSFFENTPNLSQFFYNICDEILPFEEIEQLIKKEASLSIKKSILSYSISKDLVEKYKTDIFNDDISHNFKDKNESAFFWRFWGIFRGNSRVTKLYDTLKEIFTGKEILLDLITKFFYMNEDCTTLYLEALCKFPSLRDIMTKKFSIENFNQYYYANWENKELLFKCLADYDREACPLISNQKIYEAISPRLYKLLYDVQKYCNDHKAFIFETPNLSSLDSALNFIEIINNLKKPLDLMRICLKGYSGINIVPNLSVERLDQLSEKYQGKSSFYLIDESAFSILMLKDKFLEPFEEMLVSCTPGLFRRSTFKNGECIGEVIYKGLINHKLYAYSLLKNRNIIDTLGNYSDIDLEERDTFDSMSIEDLEAIENDEKSKGLSRDATIRNIGIRINIWPKLLK